MVRCAACDRTDIPIIDSRTKDHLSHPLQWRTGARRTRGRPCPYNSYRRARISLSTKLCLAPHRQGGAGVSPIHRPFLLLRSHKSLGATLVTKCSCVAPRAYATPDLSRRFENIGSSAWSTASPRVSSQLTHDLRLHYEQN